MMNKLDQHEYNQEIINQNMFIYYFMKKCD